MAGKRLGLRQIGTLQPGATVWDETLPGFGARRQKGAAVSYVPFYRTKEGRQRWFTIGRHGAPWTPETARTEARRLLGQVADEHDPALEKRTARNVKSVSELCDVYLEDATAGRVVTRRRAAKKPSTLATDRGRIERHIKPLLGRRSVAAITREDVDAFMHDVAAGKTAGKFKTKPRGLARVRGGMGTASRTVGLLGGIFEYAVRHRMRPDNPVRGVIRPADGRRDRRLSDDEYKALGSALRKANEAKLWPAAIAAVHFVALTGWRSGEVELLRREEVDAVRRTALLSDSKTGRSARPLSHAACRLLERPTINESYLAFPAARGRETKLDLSKFWKRLAKLGSLPPDVTLHILRHSFASVASDLGFSDATIGSLIGHKGHTITSRYVHSADAVLLAAANAVAERISNLLDGRIENANIIRLNRGGG